ncbi:hypothetical protein HK407_07g12080 [Ordospora pajunii]|uniref:uncharacterized protein n=1 Tax=Ordospora pajunii TaxID=3039483 RepID=UPI0029527F90|nr:uncharacterized protein HK407_07g12080 [Ordospora pajunii]KAH9411215.1 hypothetical protein HK407_07g12080 [Ordospora pajunii]
MMIAINIEPSVLIIGIEKLSMVYKRKRNVKIDNNKSYAICKPGSTDELLLEEYVPPTLDTGMEADEEKEVHLKSIIEEGKGDIPIPVIVDVDNLARREYGKYFASKRYVEWLGDASNEYIVNSDDERSCREMEISKEKLQKLLLTISRDQCLSNENKKYVEMVASRILVRSDKLDSPAYICFRRRVVKPNRRSRKCEELAKEKVERMWTEFYLLEKLCKLYYSKNRLERESEDVEDELVKVTYTLMKGSTRSTRRKIARKIRGDAIKPSESTNGGREGLLFDRWRIKALRRRIAEAKDKACTEENEAEVKALRRYNLMHNK